MRSWVENLSPHVVRNNFAFHPWKGWETQPQCLCQALCRQRGRTRTFMALRSSCTSYSTVGVIIPMITCSKLPLSSDFKSSISSCNKRKQPCLNTYNNWNEPLSSCDLGGFQGFTTLPSHRRGLTVFTVTLRLYLPCYCHALKSTQWSFPKVTQHIYAYLQLGY